MTARRPADRGWQDETPDPDRRHARQRNGDRLSSRIKRAGGVGLVAGLSLIAGAAYGVQQLIPLWPTQLRADVDTATATAKANADAITDLRAAVRANAASVQHLTETVAASAEKAEGDVEQLDARVQWSHDELSEDVRELKEDVRAMRDDIKQLIREARP